MYRYIKQFSLLSVAFAALAFFFVPQTCSAQMLDPVDWTMTAEPQENGEYLLIFKAKVDEGWKIYGQDVAEGGPIPTSINFMDSSLFEFVDEEWKALGRKESAFEPLFDMDLTWFKKTAIFRRTIKPNKPGLLKGYVEYMTCDNEQCLPPTEEEFAFTLQVGAAATGSAIPAATDDGPFEPVIWKVSSESLGGNEYLLSYKAKIHDGWKLYGRDIAEGGPIPTTIEVEGGSFEPVGEMSVVGDLEEAFEPLFDMDLKWFKKEVEFTQKIRSNSIDTPITGFIEYMSCDNGQCIFPQPFEFELDLKTGDVKTSADKLGGTGLNTGVIDCGTTQINNPDEREEESRSYLIIFGLGLVGGFLALLTPCVFPMIPLTVSFFTKRSETKAKGVFNAWFYGFCIVLVYFLLSLPFIIFELPPDTLSKIATSVGLNVAFFVIFIFFAGSFFGYYDISLPTSWSNKADEASDVGGLVGIFFMAVTLALVSFSCTGPILGSLLAGSLQSGGGQYDLVAGMLGFGVALALPFGIFAGFPSLLSALPKSGGWLNTVKVVLGFLELGLAFKFLSNADLVIQTGLLKREIFLAIWVVVCFGIVLYMMGWIRFPHDSPKIAKSFGRLSTAALFLALGVYIVPGLAGKNLSLISGFPPPMWYSFYPPSTPANLADGRDVYSGETLYMVSSDQSKVVNKETGEEVGEGALREQVLHDQEHFKSCPGGLMCFHDWDEGVAFATKYNKPIMIDFTGWACVNCRRMEENVWVKPEIDKLIREDYVLISLYVDDKRKLAEEEKYISCETQKEIKSIGAKWADFQYTNFRTSSQPYYVLLTAEGEVLNETAYEPSVEKYREFLQTGLDKFGQLAGKNGSLSAQR